MVKKLSAEQEKRLCKDYQDGMTPLELSLRYGIATNTIWRYLVINNIPRQRRAIKNKNVK